MGEDKEFLKKVARLLDNPQDKDLLEEVERERSASAAREKIYQDFVRLWNLSEGHGVSGLIPVKEAVENLSNRLGIELERSRPGILRLLPWLAAASVLLVLAFWFYREAQSPVLITKRTLPGQVDSVELGDKSLIYIAGNSEFTYPEKFGDKREVYLKSGEAFFKISRDEAHPFVVQLGPSRVTVLGTSFNISNNKQTVEVSVKTGKVRFEVEDGGKDIILNTGSAVLYNYADGNYKLSQNISQNNFAWLTNELSFVDAPLREVLHELERYYKVKFVSDSFTSDSKFNANFKNSDLDEVLEILKETYPIQIVRRDSLVYVRGNN